jgi:hypothetical protein
MVVPMDGRWLFILAVTGAGMAVSAQTETQHAFDAGIRLTPRLDLVLHARIRTQPGQLGFYQVRGGPVFEYTLQRAWKLIAGYYYAQQENSAEDFIKGTAGLAGPNVHFIIPEKRSSMCGLWRNASNWRKAMISTGTVCASA